MISQLGSQQYCKSQCVAKVTGKRNNVKTSHGALHKNEIKPRVFSFVMARMSELKKNEQKEYRLNRFSPLPEILVLSFINTQGEL